MSKRCPASAMSAVSCNPQMSIHAIVPLARTFAISCSEESSRSSKNSSLYWINLIETRSIFFLPMR